MTRRMVQMIAVAAFLVGAWCVAGENPPAAGSIRIKEIEVKIAQIAADSTVEVQMAKLTLEMKRLQLARAKKLVEAKAAEEAELQQAQIEQQMAEVNLQAAEEHRAVRALELERAKAELAIAMEEKRSR